MENTQESTQVPSAQIEQVSQFQESLTPTLLKEHESAYESVRDLREALKAEDVLNIALTGPYAVSYTHLDVYKRQVYQCFAS